METVCNAVVPEAVVLEGYRLLQADRRIEKMKFDFPVGFKYGCLRIEKKEKVTSIYDESSYAIKDGVEISLKGIEYFRFIVTLKCTCGLEFEQSFNTEKDMISGLSAIFCKRRRFCDWYKHRSDWRCGNRRWKRIEYGDKTGMIHDTLVLLERLEPDSKDYKYSFPYMYCYRKYRCRCTHCGNEYIFLEKQFEIFDTKGEGYKSEAYCKKCRLPIPSSLEWRTVKVLQQLGIRYDVQQHFFHLRGIGGGYPSFDFLIYGENKADMKGLIECQGRQHYEPSFGESEFQQQKCNDEIKRDYAKKLNLPLLEASYKDRRFEETIETFCRAILNERGD